MREARSCRTPNLGCRGPESPGRLDVSPENSAGGMMCGWGHCCDEAANHQRPQLRPSESSECFCGEVLKLKTKFDADSLLYLLSYFECDGHTIHILSQWQLPSPLTSTVKFSLFTHLHSSPLSLAARLYRCGTNHSCYVNNGWHFLDRPFILTIFSFQIVAPFAKLSHSKVCHDSKSSLSIPDSHGTKIGL